MSLKIIYEDNQIIVLDKEPGQTVIPGRGVDESRTLVRELERYTGGKIYVVHRLDRDTSGVILFAKNASAHRELSLQFERRETGKTYLAAVAGIMEGEGEINKPVYQFGSGRMGVDKRGKSSLTCYKVLKNMRDSSYLEVKPATGRRHQIRVHLYSTGHPVMGDTLYGENRPVGGVSRLMLHAYQISFTLSGVPKRLTAEPDSEWNDILKALG